MNFDEASKTYRELVERSIAFAGKGHDFYTAVKADVLEAVIKTALPDVASPLVADIGCGHGYMHPALGRFGCKVVGVESALAVLPLARNANPDAWYVGYAGGDLPFRSHSFDAAIAVCVMHHVPAHHWLALLREMLRVLRPGGIVVIFEHNPLNPLTRYVVARNELDAHAVLLSAQRLRGLLREAGFRRVGTRYILFTPLESRPFRLVDAALGWLPLGAQYYATGIA